MGAVRVCKKVVATRTGERSAQGSAYVRLQVASRKSQLVAGRRLQVAGPWALLLLLWLHFLVGCKDM